MNERMQTGISALLGFDSLCAADRVFAAFADTDDAEQRRRAIGLWLNCQFLRSEGWPEHRILQMAVGFDNGPPLKTFLEVLKTQVGEETWLDCWKPIYEAVLNDPRARKE